MDSIRKGQNNKLIRKPSHNSGTNACESADTECNEDQKTRVQTWKDFESKHEDEPRLGMRTEAREKVRRNCPGLTELLATGLADRQADGHADKEIGRIGVDLWEKNGWWRARKHKDAKPVEEEKKKRRTLSTPLLLCIIRRY